MMKAARRCMEEISFPPNPRVPPGRVGLHGGDDPVGTFLDGAIAMGLGLDENYFADHYTADPLILFRIFNYPPIAPSLGVGDTRTTDY